MRASGVFQQANTSRALYVAVTYSVAVHFQCWGLVANISDQSTTFGSKESDFDET
jgi:hypothetical protein